MDLRPYLSNYYKFKGLHYFRENLARINFSRNCPVIYEKDRERKN